MKALYTLLIFTGLNPFLFAQYSPFNSVVPDAEEPQLHSIPTNPTTHSQGQQKGAVIWSEDFAFGFPSGWTIQDGSGICPWVYSKDGSWGNFNGNGGVAAAAAINSTTAANGFLICDPDSANNVTYGQPSGTNYQYLDSYFTTKAIDLSAHPAVNLEFEQLFRKNNSIDLEVQVSTDNATWTTWTVQGTTANNTASADPDKVSINISSVAGGQPTVYIKIGWSARVYYWMIDDMKIVEAPANDLSLDQHYYYGYTDVSSTGYYTQIPVKQAQVDTLVFGADFSNNGSASQTNTQLTVNISGTQTATLTTAPITVSSGAIDSANVTATHILPSLGAYAVDFSIGSDSTDFAPADNMISDSIYVTDTVFARDNGMPNTGRWYGAPGETYKFGSLFYVGAQDSCTSISIYIGDFNAPYSQEGKIISFQLINFNTATREIMAEKAFYTIQAADLGTWVTFPLTPTGTYTSTELAPGYYLAGFEAFSDTTMFVTGTGDPNAPDYTSYVELSGTWYYNSRIGFIRMNTKNNPCISNLIGTVSDVSCNGANDGSIVLSGVAGSTYNWSSMGINGSSANNLAPGNYGVTVTDGGSCTWNGSYTINEPTTLVSSTSSLDASCGLNNGTAIVAGVGGTGNYSYNWSGGNSTTDSISNIVAGTYYVTVMDSAGCTSIDTAVVAGTPAVSITTTTTESECDSTNGTATATIATGTSPYTYAWNDAMSQSTATATGLDIGTYTVVVTDTNGCSDTSFAAVTNLNAPVITDVISNALCFGDTTGSIAITVTGGTGAYSYSWSTSDTLEDISGLLAGSYTLTVTDSLNCQTISTYNVGEPTALFASDSTTNILCKGDSSGTGSIFASGGTTLYTYLWDDSTTASVNSNLFAGTHNYTVTDNNGCTVTGSVNITEPSTSITVTASVTSTSGGQNNGAIDITVSNGASPYTFNWSTSNGSGLVTLAEDQSGLSDGDYYVKVTDANGCIWDTTYSVRVNIEQLNTHMRYRLYPNPTAGPINVAIENGEGEYNLALQNMLGETIYLDRFNANGNVLRIVQPLDITPGVYFLTLRGSYYQRTHKIIVK